MNSYHLRVTDLPPVLQRGLKRVGYGKEDVEIRVKESFSPSPPSSKGRRGFCVACRLDETGEIQAAWGSFGGANPFVKSVDDATEVVKIPPGVAFITGVGGAGPGYPAHASVTISPSNVNPKLVPMKASVSEKESNILAVFKGIKSSYRKEYLARLRATDDEVDSLVARGYLKRAKNGATRITTDGRNAASSTMLL